jgi:hypothetical protein
LLVEHRKSGVDESVPEFPYLRRLSRLRLCSDWLSLFFAINPPLTGLSWSLSIVLGSDDSSEAMARFAAAVGSI